MMFYTFWHFFKWF